MCVYIQMYILLVYLQIRCMFVNFCVAGVKEVSSHAGRKLKAIPDSDDEGAAQESMVAEQAQALKRWGETQKAREKARQKQEEQEGRLAQTLEMLRRKVHGKMLTLLHFLLAISFCIRGAGGSGGGCGERQETCDSNGHHNLTLSQKFWYNIGFRNLM